MEEQAKMIDLKVYPTQIEATRADGTRVFVVTTKGEVSAEVEIEAPINAKDWDKIAPKVREALVSMRLSGDCYSTEHERKTEAIWDEVLQKLMHNELNLPKKSASPLTEDQIADVIRMCSILAHVLMGSKCL